MHGPKPKPVIGIIGGIGSGKSAVAGEFESLGCALIQADAIGHELLADNDVKLAIRRRWGDRVFGLDGNVDRSVLGKTVFADKSELDALNAIMHPRIRRRMIEAIAAASLDESIRAIVLDAAVLLEAGWDDLCTHIVFVDAPAEIRRQRIRQARGWSERDWLTRENSQFSLDTKKSRCYCILSNDSSVSRLQEQVRQIFNRIVQVTEKS